MYFVDRNKIEEVLVYMEKLLALLDSHTFSSKIEKLAQERIVHTLIESTLDVGNMMIDGFIMRDPGSYEDIIDILIDEKVVPAEDETAYKAFIGLRKVLVTDYTEVDHDELNRILAESIPVIKSFSSHIRNYLKNELGVANAFLKSE